MSYIKKPLLIVGEHQLDMTYISLLLSNHTESGADFKSMAFTAQDNRFSTAYLFHYLYYEAEYQKPEQVASVLALQWEAGTDAGLLWGLVIPFAVYQLVAPYPPFADCEPVFIFNETEILLAPQPENRINEEELLPLLKKHKGRILNSIYFYSSPIRVVDYIARLWNMKVIKLDEIKPQPFEPTDHKFRSGEVLQQLRSIDAIRDTYSNGSSIAAFFFISNEKQLIECYKRMMALAISVPESIDVWIICNSIPEEFPEEHSHLLERIGIHFIVREEHIGKQCNQLISSCTSSVILIDDLTLTYPLHSVLESYFQYNSSFHFAVAGSESETITLHNSELPGIYFPEHLLLFSKTYWNQIQGFDEQYPDTACFYDFFLRYMLLLQLNAVVFRVPTLQNIKTVSPETTKRFQQIVRSHQKLLAAVNDQIFDIISQVQINRKEEVEKAYGNLSSVQYLLDHSKAELKAMAEMNQTLHSRIRLLEQSWYHRFYNRFEKIRRIFFKKNSPGTGTLKRILQFIRFTLSRSGAAVLRKGLASFFKQLYLFVEKRPVEIIYPQERDRAGIYNYHHWITHKLDTDTLRENYEEERSRYTENRLISIVMPVYNTPPRYLKAAIESVRMQLYDRWELCIADDCSTHPGVKRILKAYEAKDQRIRVTYRKENGHISATSNTALEMTRGEYIHFMDHDDLLTINCVWEIAKAIQENPEAGIIYSDEDKIDERNFHQSAYFKPDWSPDHLLAKNYIGHVCVIQKKLIQQVGAFRLGFEGSQDYDLLLRCTEQTHHIINIPKVLYHWRIHSLSAAQGEDVKPYAYIAAKKALEEAIHRRGLKGRVRYLNLLRGYRIDFDIQKPGWVDIIIPTKDQTELLKNAVDSIFKHTSYKQFRITILNNNSHTKEFASFCEEYPKKYPGQVQIVDAHFPFNFSKLMNTGVSITRGDYVLLLNNDVEVTEPDWLKTMVSFAQQKHIGAVGARLLYPDDTIQHAGVIVGLGGIAGHAFTGQYKEDPGYFNLIQTVNNFSAVTAACLMVRRDVFNEVGGMDITFEVEYNDVDFCLKLQQAGYYNVYVPQVELYHYESATRGHPHQSKASYERHLKEMALFKSKWQTVIDRDPFYNPNLNLGVHDFSMNLQA
ncbi:MAG TPA: glycosyltransferase family 2 protein [Chitinophagaceae bacterium]|nr:glycosyltransferase family 2 protein [Chitinophagaceae bacterium]